MPTGQDATIAEVMAKPGRQSRVASRAAIRKDNVLIISMLPQHLHRARRPRYASTKTAPVMPAGFDTFAGFWFAAGAPGSLAREEQPKKQHSTGYLTVPYEWITKLDALQEDGQRLARAGTAVGALPARGRAGPACVKPNRQTSADGGVFVTYCCLVVMGDGKDRRNTLPTAFSRRDVAAARFWRLRHRLWRISPSSP